MLGVISKNLYKLKKNKEGVMAIEIVIGMFMFLMLLCFLTDLLVLSWKFSVVSQINSKVARVAGIQGGILSSAPPGYPGGEEAYTNTREMYALINEHFRQGGIKNDEWTLSINGRNAKNISTSKIDYRTSFETEIGVTYRWDLVSNFLPGEMKNTLKSTRPTISEWKYNYDSWLGE